MPRPTSAASSSAQLERETRDETDKSVERSKDESPVRRTPARKKRARKISSDSGSSSSSDSSSSSNSSSSEDEAMAKDKVIDRSEEEQLRVLEEKRAAHKRLKSRMKKKAMGSLIRKVKKYKTTMRKSQETEKEAEKTKAEQQEEEEAAEAETPEADLVVTEREERSRKERSARRIVRERHIKDRLGKPAPPAAGETSAAAADRAKRLCRLGKPAPPAAGETSEAMADSAKGLRRPAGYKIPRLVSPIRKCFLESFETLPTPMEDCIVRAPETTQQRLLFGILVDAGMVLSGKQAASYIRLHYRFQRREDNRKFYSD